MDGVEGVTLTTLASGTAEELFQHELEKVLRNIADPNTPTKTARKITLTVAIVPDDSRDAAAVQISCKSVIASPKAQATAVYLGKQGARFVAMEFNPKQTGLFDKTSGPTPIRPVEEGANQ